MTLGAAARLASLAVAVTAFGAVAVGGYVHPAFIAAWLAGAIYASRVPERRFRGRHVLATALFALPVVGALVVRGLDPVLGAAYFVAVLLLARLIVREGAESAAQIQLLSMLMMAGGAALSPDVTYLVFFVGYVLAAVWALLLNHLRREAGDEALSQPVRELVGRGLAWSTVGLTLLALVGTATIFVFFPRTSFGLGYMRAAAGTEGGLSDRIELAGFGRFGDDDRVLLRVEADPAFGGDHVPVYWRAGAFERYDGTSWTAGERVYDRDTSWMVSLRSPTPGAEPLKVEVEQVADLGVSLLAVPDQAVVARGQGRDARGRRLELRVVEPKEVRTAGRPAAPFRYQAHIDRGIVVVDHRPPDAGDLALPPQSPEVIALAERLAAGAGEEATAAVGSDPAADATGGAADTDSGAIAGARANASKAGSNATAAALAGILAARVEGYLQTELGYTLEPPTDPSLDHFLLERREGHCEYFATAMTVLLRLQGVPARVATGFYGATWNETGGYWTVRQRDAHAWVEVHRAGTGWVRYDPTPPAGRGSGGAREGLLDRLEDLWDAVQQRWSVFVLDYSLRDQIEVARGIARSFRKVADAFEGGPGGWLERAGPFLLGLTLLAAAALAVRLRWRRGAAGRKARLNPAARRAAGVYREVVRAARAAGLTRRPSDTPDELVEALRRAAGPKEAVHLESIVRVYQAVRFGGRGLSPQEARVLRARARRVARDLRRAA